MQKAWLDLDVVQCGYCQSGQIMAAAALLAKIHAPTDTDIDQAMSGNICRCGARIRASARPSSWLLEMVSPHAIPPAFRASYRFLTLRSKA